MGKKTHIFVATPMYGGQCFGFYTQSILLLNRELNAAGMDVGFSFMFNESLITRARNSLVKSFLDTPEATHLLFIDADIKFFPEQVIPMIAANKDIICGIYPKKEISWPLVRRAIEEGVSDDELKYHTGSFVVNLVDYSGEVTVPVHEPVEIWNGGTGFMLIKRSVFKKLASKVPSYTNNIVDLSKSQEPGIQIKEYFTTSIEEETNILLSEDYHFCKLARKHGIKIWAAPWVQLGHVGTYPFEGRLSPSK
ncbi:hypothetical protein UFOVP1627_16 [uncultured Caudovirales phage]|jgi:hypothetical protein|uniref:Uncharacterized protein n=1 Tax=uncultured Caudovirales phage TaxID=2100421 RepID=A0A6J7XFB4_9CAUD|nr:hypothetical protein UFOVP1113_20 [uncultured Caudovirales phage]CAB4219756.1 hypothetical protein UFOVP1627_16 [uncultured Caudovirales phage]CAB5229840.1 hypothetical protein UFOVP1563_34 [uncultured Caudovirales phage]